MKPVVLVLLLVLGTWQILVSSSSGEMHSSIWRQDHPCCFHFPPLMVGE